MRCVVVSLALVFGCVSLPLNAGPIAPAFQDFGELGAATFGGTGIPNDAVAIRSILRSDNVEAPFTLGLTAHQRYFNPPLTNDGNGTFAALPGANFGGPGDPSATLGALWNVGFYIQFLSGGQISDFQFQLLYDFDPAANTDEADHGILDLNSALAALGGDPTTTSLLEGSENMNFSYFASLSSFILNVPTVSPFDPNAEGKYSFALVAKDDLGAELGRVAIVVDTTVAAAAAVPEPATLLVFGALAGIMLGTHRRRNIMHFVA